MKLHQEGSAPALDRAAAWAPAIGLDTLPRHQPATVSALRPARSTAEKDVVLRLMEIGFLPGEPVRVVAAGFPGGDPIAVRIGQATFALRRHEAALIEVQVEGATA
ncbi:MAG: ferrous iron transport protein A [Comamonadaceae bacterium]|nr:MAG: ferrous iron transport protein A [Comamonadaceae bacterium]